MEQRNRPPTGRRLHPPDDQPEQVEERGGVRFGGHAVRHQPRGTVVAQPRKVLRRVGDTVDNALKVAVGRLGEERQEQREASEEEYHTDESGKPPVRRQRPTGGGGTRRNGLRGGHWAKTFPLAATEPSTGDSVASLRHRAVMRRVRARR